MELSTDQKKKAWLLLGGVAVLVVILLLIRGYQSFLGAKAPSVPQLSESIIGGRLKGKALQEGTNVLEFTATTGDGTVISDTVTFKVLPPGPYDPGTTPAPPDPYDPGTPTTTPDPPGPY
ncbi:hypothetical protein CL628_01155 [bacterium]|nr:hypothetical protein [bacterium]